MLGRALRDMSLHERPRCPVCGDEYTAPACGRADIAIPFRSFDYRATVRQCTHPLPPVEYRTTGDECAADISLADDEDEAAELAEDAYEPGVPVWVYVHEQSDVEDYGEGE